MRIDFKDMKSMNVPKYCRKLMKGEYPKTLEIYRGNMLCLTVDVEKASKMLMIENSKEGPIYDKYTPRTEEQIAQLRSMGKARTHLTLTGALK